jgi:hypothetical protein
MQRDKSNKILLELIDLGMRGYYFCYYFFFIFCKRKGHIRIGSLVLLGMSGRTPFGPHPLSFAVKCCVVCLLLTTAQLNRTDCIGGPSHNSIYIWSSRKRPLAILHGALSLFRDTRGDLARIFFIFCFHAGRKETHQSMSR